MNRESINMMQYLDDEKKQKEYQEANEKLKKLQEEALKSNVVVQPTLEAADGFINEHDSEPGLDTHEVEE